MKVYILNHSSSPLPIKEEQIVLTVNKIFYYLAENQVQLPPSVNQLTIVFQETKEVQKLNKKFRIKDKPTDVLSFQPIESTSLGEIILAIQIIRSQAIKNRHSFLSEVGYLILHGILHLLGYEHEAGGKEEKEMMQLQDNIFDQLKNKI